jgi:hypothetical protein
LSLFAYDEDGNRLWATDLGGAISQASAAIGDPGLKIAVGTDDTAWRIRASASNGSCKLRVEPADSAFGQVDEAT